MTISGKRKTNPKLKAIEKFRKQQNRNGCSMENVVHKKDVAFVIDRFPPCPFAKHFGDWEVAGPLA